MNKKRREKDEENCGKGGGKAEHVSYGVNREDFSYG
jgi:hypothetical protein